MFRTILEIVLAILILRFINNLFNSPSPPPQNHYQPPQQPTEPKKQERKSNNDDEYIDYEEVK